MRCCREWDADAAVTSGRRRRTDPGPKRHASGEDEALYKALTTFGEGLVVFIAGLHIYSITANFKNGKRYAMHNLGPRGEAFPEF